MPDIISATDIPALFINDIPLLDVRAPVEFSRGAFPHAVNLPLLDDAERDIIGKTYKAAGQQAAIALGHKLVSGDTLAQRLTQWQRFIQHHPNAVLYCFRGGLRSQTVQNWLADHGIHIPRVDGGYKRMRRELLNSLEHDVENTELVIVAGKTGSGKTHLINALTHSIDLEGLANHRGSAFGNRVSNQPSQIDFENALAIDFLKLPQPRSLRLFLEDESRAIGSRSLPQSLYGKMLDAPLALLEVGLEERVDTILNDYIISNYMDFKQSSPEQADQLFADYLLQSLGKIRRRLGGENYSKLLTIMEYALSVTATDIDAHRDWIRTLLQKYYDPMYDYQLDKKSSRIVFRGSRDELLNWAAHLDKPAQVVKASA